MIWFNNFLVQYNHIRWESFVYCEPVWHLHRIIHCLCGCFVFWMAGIAFIHDQIFHSPILFFSLFAATLAFALGFPSFDDLNFWLAWSDSCEMEVSAILNVLFYDRQKRDDFLFESCIYCLFKYQIFLDGLMQLLQMSCRMFAFLILEFELHIYLFLFKNIYIILSNISSLLSLFCLVFMVYVNYNSIMKKARSPNKNALASLL